MSNNEQITTLSFAWRFARLLARPGVIETMRYTFKARTDDEGSLCDLLEDNAVRLADHPALRYEDTILTWRELNEECNRYANYFYARGIRHGDIIGINLQNRPEIVITTLAALKLGAIAAMINTTQTGQVLAHSLALATPKLLVIGEECVANMETVTDILNTDYTGRLLYLPDMGGPAPANYTNMAQAAAAYGTDNLPIRGGFTLSMPCYYIYTSGTTGLPKAAISTHFKAVRSGRYVGKIVMSMTPDDIYYCPLPYYHSNALLLSLGCVLATGASLAIGRKFSATRFWDECRHHGATTFCYIGETLRYLLNQPEKPDDRDHSVTKIIGNGLRPDIWNEFKDRFGIDRIHEFYGASESNAAFINLLNYDKTCGWFPGQGKSWTIVEYDIDTDEPVRDENGRLKPVAPGETGLLVVAISDTNPFDGYTDAQASEKKLIRGAFEDGDIWFDSGDLVKRLPMSHIQFADRVGDTFRWSGENVATTEVEACFLNWPNVEDAVVYGVQIPKQDGRCGMVALTPSPDADIDLTALVAYLRNTLPPYAIPRFLRLTDGADLTGTFKHIKGTLKKEGYDPALVSGPLYFLDPSADDWVPITPELKQQIDSGDIRL